MERNPSKAPDHQALAGTGTKEAGVTPPGAQRRIFDSEPHSASAIERQLVRESMRGETEEWIQESLAGQDEGSNRIRRHGYTVLLIALLMVLGAAVFMLRDSPYASLPVLQWIEEPLVQARDTLQQWMGLDETAAPIPLVDPNTDPQRLQQARASLEQAARLVPELNDDPRFRALLEELRQAGDPRD